MNSLQCSAFLGFIIEQVPLLGRLKLWITFQE